MAFDRLLPNRVYLLKAVEDLKVATAVRDLGLLSKAEEAGVFSKLEGLGAFSLAEKLLPTIEKWKLLSLFESLLDVEAATTFTAANFIIVSGAVLWVLQLFGFVPIPQGPGASLGPWPGLGPRGLGPGPGPEVKIIIFPKGY